MMDKKPHIKPYLYGMLAGFGAISLSILFFFLIYRFQGFGDAISKLTGILMPFIYGAVIAYLLKPELFEGKFVNVEIETTPGLGFGQTVVDRWAVTGRQKNATWITKVDADGFFALILEAFRRLP